MVDLIITLAPETRLKVLSRWIGPVEIVNLLSRGADQGKYVCRVLWLTGFFNELI